MASNENTPVLKRKTNTRSWVCKYFSNQNQRAFFNICNSIVNWNKNGSSQLAWHLNSVHKLFKNSKNLDQNPSPTQNDFNVESEDERDEHSELNNNKKKKKIDDSLVNFLVNNNLPMSIVNNENFKKFVKNLTNDYNLPSRGFLTYNLIPEKVVIS